MPKSRNVDFSLVKVNFFKEPNNTLVVPLIKNKFIVISQKREPINKKNFEFPMGWIDKGETPIKAGKRELIEETGYKSLSKLILKTKKRNNKFFIKDKRFDINNNITKYKNLINSV